MVSDRIPSFLHLVRGVACGPRGFPNWIDTMQDIPLGRKLRHRTTGERWEMVGYCQTLLRCRNASGEIKRFHADEMSMQGKTLSAEERRQRKNARARGRYARKVLAA